MGIFLLVTIPAVIKVTQRLRMKTTSHNLKDKILKRYHLYFAVYMMYVVQTVLVYAMQTIFADEIHAGVWFTITILTTSGLLLTFVRVNEPAIMFNIKNDISHLMSNNKETKKAAFTDDHLDSFLNSALNVEFVYILLLGITTYYDND